MKQFTEIKFEIPVSEMSNVNFKLTSIHHGTITVRGTADLREREDIEVDFDSIEINGFNVLDVLQHSEIFESAFERIQELAHDHAVELARDQYLPQLQD